jgi:hypothetical protein
MIYFPGFFYKVAPCFSCDLLQKLNIENEGKNIVERQLVFILIAF